MTLKTMRYNTLYIEKIKYLIIKLTKQAQELCKENYKTLTKKKTK